MPEKQAEVHAEAIAELVDERLATKQDIYALKHDINSIKRGMKDLEERLTYKLTIRLGLMLAASITIITTLVKVV